MKFFIVLVLVAFASATPLSGWGEIDGHYLPHKFTYGYGGYEAPHYKQFAASLEAIQKLQWQLHQHPFEQTEYPYVSIKTPYYHYPQDLQLHETTKTGVETQINANGDHIPLVTGLHSGVFQTKRPQKLIDEYDWEVIEKQISDHHHWAQQLHHQQEFVHQQKKQIEAQQELTGQFHHLEAVHHQLEGQEHHLIQEQLAHHFAIIELVKGLVHKEQQVLQETVAEHTHGKIVHGITYAF